TRLASLATLPTRGRVGPSSPFALIPLRQALAARAESRTRRARPREPSCQKIPARIGPEALAVALGQAFELGADVGGPARARAVHGPAAARRGPCREEHGPVEGALAPHYALAHTAHTNLAH